MSRILAVDWGERHIGLAISDPLGLIATGLDTLHVRNRAEALRRVSNAATANEATLIVVGLPLLMSGKRGEAAQAALQFSNALAARCGLPVDTYDERLTSALSQRRLKEVGVRTGQNKGRVDQGAAIALLESYLLRLRNRAATEEA